MKPKLERTLISFGTHPRSRQADRDRRRLQPRLRVESLEGRALLASGLTPQERLLAGLQMQSNSQAVKKDGADAARYIQTIADQLSQVAADAVDGLNTDINQARGDKVEALASGDTQTAAADTQAVQGDIQGKSKILQALDQGMAAIDEAIREVSGLNKQENKDTTQDERSVDRGQASPDDAKSVQQAQSSAIDSKIQDVKDDAFKDVQIIGQDIINLSPNFDPGNRTSNPGTVDSPPSNSFNPGNDNPGGNNSNGGGNQGGGSQARIVGPLIGSLTAYSSTVNMDVTEPLGATLMIAADGSITGPADVENQPLVDTNTGQVTGYESSSSGTITGTFRAGSLASKGTFSFAFPSGRQVSIPWQATITDTGVDGILLSGSQKIGMFTLTKGTR